MAQVSYRTAIYCRLSVLDSAKQNSESIQTQQKFLEDYITKTPELKLNYIFVDNGSSGVDFDRPSWLDLMDKCKSHKIDCIVLKDLSRLGRNYIETGEYLEHIFPQLGIRVITVNDNYDSIKLTNNTLFTANLQILVNDLYAKDISQKTISAKHIKQKQGAFIGAYPSYGYLKDPINKNKIIIDPETAPIVKQIFEWKSAGFSNVQICRCLHNAKIPSPNNYRLTKGIVKHKKYENCQWSTSVIRRILLNEIYLGHMVQGRSQASLYKNCNHRRIAQKDFIVIQNTHNPIISKLLYDRANAVMNKRKSLYYKQTTNHTKHDNNKLLSPLQGLVFCSDCGKQIHSNQISCTDRYHNHINLKNLSKAVSEAIRIELLKSADIKVILQKKVKFCESKIKAAEKRIIQLSTLKQTLFEDYITNLITTSEYQAKNEQYHLETIKQNINLVATIKKKVSYMKIDNILGQSLNTKEMTSEITQAMIERIEISHNNNITITFKYRDVLYW